MPVRLKQNLRWNLCAFIVLDILCVGMGMGVPIFCILFGFPVGWRIARLVTASAKPIEEVLGKILLYATVTSACTFVMMGALWGGCAVMLLYPDADFVKFGIPMILYEPKASIIGWMVLMIAISPFLQLLLTLFGAYVTLLRRLTKEA